MLAVLVLFAARANAEPRKWNGTVQTGLAQTMQLSLGGLFNRGPAVQSRVTLGRSGLLRSRDSIHLYAWKTADTRSGATDADMGVRYRSPIAPLAGGTLIGGGGVEHWNFPSVLGGTRDLVLDSYLGWNAGERFPLTISANGKTLAVSDLPRGTMLCLQAQYSHRLARRGATVVSLQHGPNYVYSWNVYGRGGHRVLRYSMMAQLSRRSWSLEAGFRPQAGLQPAIPDNRFWSVSIIKRFSL